MEKPLLEVPPMRSWWVLGPALIIFALALLAAAIRMGPVPFDDLHLVREAKRGVLLLMASICALQGGGFLRAAIARRPVVVVDAAGIELPVGVFLFQVRLEWQEVRTTFIVSEGTPRLCFEVDVGAWVMREDPSYPVRWLMRLGHVFGRSVELTSPQLGGARLEEVQALVERLRREAAPGPAPGS